MRSILIAILTLVACGAAGAAEPTIYQQAVADEDRSAADRERDARELPAEVLAFAGIKPGMRVADVLAGGGYYSELLSRVVGPNGEVLLVNNPPYADFGKEGLAKRFTPGRLSNVKRSVVQNDDLKLGTGTLDAIVMVMAYHDLYWVSEKDGWPAVDAKQFLGQLARALKPGGVLLIVDHAAEEGTGSSVAGTLHRIGEQFARKDFESHGLRFEGSFDKLRNPADDRSAGVFNPAVRGRTDRFAHLYRKP